MCKFDSERSAGYDIVMDAISFYVEDAENNHTVAVRWTQEKQRRRIESGHLTEGYGTPQPEISEPSSRGSSPAGRAPNLISHRAHNVEYEIEELQEQDEHQTVHAQR